MDFNKITDEIIQSVGGEDNIISLSHCMTRLRFVLKDENKANINETKKIQTVLGATFGAGQLQVIMGQNLHKAYEAIMNRYQFSDSPSKQTPSSHKHTLSAKFLLTEVLNFIAGSVSPVVTGLVAGGMLKLILFIASMIQPELEITQTYIFLSFVADVPFYFMPVFVAYGASKKLGCAPVYPMIVACSLIHPTFITLIGEGTPLHLLGLPVLAIKYSSSMIPALLSTISVYYLEKLFNKIIPGVLKTISVGVLTVLCATVLAFVVFGPLGTYIGNYVVGFMIWLQTVIGPIALGVLTAILPFMVLTGMHTLLAPFLIESLNVTGFDTFFRPALILHVIAEGGAALGVAFRTKNKIIRSEALSIGIGSIFAGISEPAIYGVALRYKKPMIGVMAGGLTGGIIAGVFGVKAYTMSKTTILAIPIFKESMTGMFIACIATVLVSAIVAYIVGIDEEEKATDPITLSKQDITSVINGNVYPIETINDELFSNKTLGNGIAFHTDTNKIVSPCDGILTTVFPSGHAYGITREDGLEIMIHIGIDTVTLNGKGFDIKVKQGKSIKRGETLVELDLEYLKSTGLDLSTIMIFLNKNDELKLESNEYAIAGQTVVAKTI